MSQPYRKVPPTAGRPVAASAMGAVAARQPATAAAAPQVLHGEDRLPKTWKTLANCFIAGCQKAEKAAARTQATQQQQQQNKETQLAMKELDDYVVLFLRTRVDWIRLIAYLEAKLEGTAQEMETRQHYHRTMATYFGKNNSDGVGAAGSDRKRKRADDEVGTKPAPAPPGGGIMDR